MSKYTLIIKKDARKYRTPLFETNNNTIGLEMQQKEVKICGGVGRRAGGRLQHRKKFATRGRFRYDKRVGIWYVYLTSDTLTLFVVAEALTEHRIFLPFILSLKPHFLT